MLKNGIKKIKYQKDSGLKNWVESFVLKFLD